ncbi:polysaccharide deacetylase family protein [Fulvivirgaceae bacterium PWU5]|uniref:Polysaccharide deacetylase family protein n=1 Tax=Dawidia cretensis TaxID=2782350 RepID=A0AAP2DXJ2_9BACT|nr:polysaccharide deacetylase family protein [Dawidia cretensis]MBT1707917.1 polysaccharide deacetylase family protein [Dawidia cretensis]
MPFFKTFIITTTSILLLTAAFAQMPSTPTAKAPPAIICLTYDDALPSQLENVIPQLNALHLKATFFINSIPGSSDQLGHGSPSLIAWKAAAAQGHELANHTLFHPCPQKLGWEKDVSLETYTLDMLLSEIKTMHAYLDAITGKKKKRSFAYPCNETALNGVDYTAALRKLGVVSYGRTGGDQQSIITDVNHTDDLKMPSWHVMEGTSGEAMIAFVEKTMQSNGLGIFQFHDVGGALFNVSKEAHQKLLDYLHDNAHRVRVLTFSDAVAEMKR